MRLRLPLPWKVASQATNRDKLREFVTGLAIRSLGILETAERKAFMESEIRITFGFRKVEILLKPEGPERFTSESMRVRDILTRVLGILQGTRKPFLNQDVAQGLGVLPVLRSLEATYAFPLRMGEMRLGVLALDSSPQKQLGRDLERILLEVCSQVAVVLANSSLLRGKIELQHELAKQAQMAQLGQMTARIAHEIKNPLSAIKTIIQVMQEDRSLHSRYSRDLDLINSEVDRLSSTVMQLLTFARPASDTVEAVQLWEAAEAVLRFLERDIQLGSVIVDNEIPRDLSPPQGSPAVLREIFLNLILNALQAGGEGTHLRLQAWEGVLEDGSERFVLLVVEDDGPGIPKELHEKVFAPFFTTRQKGTGLGLAIVRRDIEHMGGHITLESPARGGRGTRFLIHLPLK